MKRSEEQAIDKLLRDVLQLGVDDNTVTVCIYCNEATTGVPCGDDDYLTFCESCQQIEPETIELTEFEYENRDQLVKIRVSKE